MLPSQANVNRVAKFLDLPREQVLEMFPASYRAQSDSVSEDLLELHREVDDLRRMLNRLFVLIDERVEVDPSLLARAAVSNVRDQFVSS